MGLLIKFLVFAALLSISLIRAQNLCPFSHCGVSDVLVHYPFKFEDEASPSTNCTYFNLTCSEAESRVVVNLPSAGDFYVQKIDYAKRYIQLYDSGNCLIPRILDLRLESSPFMANFDNFTFYLCPLDAEGDPVPCMSNVSTNKVIAVRESFKYDHQCQPLHSGMLPVEHDDTFLYLNYWDPHYCVNCKQSSWKSKLVAKLIAIALTLTGFIIMAFSCCSVYLMKMIRDKYAAAAEGPPAAAEAPPPPASNGGLEESKILGCMELVVVSERNEGTVSANSKTCSICLENYSEKETVSVMSRCGHCFHATCIRQWLGKNATCPVCRTSLFHDVV